MRRKNPFQIISDVPDTWINPYTGQTRHADPGTNPEQLLKKKNGYAANPFSIEHATEINKKNRDTDESVPDIIHLSSSTRQSDLDQAKKLFLESEEIISEYIPKEETFTKNPHRIIVGQLLDELGTNTKDFQKDGPTINPETNAQIKFKLDSDSEFGISRNQLDAIYQAEIDAVDLADPRLQSYAQTFVAGIAPAILSTVPLQGNTDKIAHELIWDILTSKGLGSDQTIEAQSNMPDLNTFLKQQVLLQAQQKSMAQEQVAAMKAADVHSDYKSNQDKLNATRNMISTDIQYVAKAAKTELKNDTLVQERVGTWAIIVMGQSVKLDKSALRKGLRKEALQALGRIAMQLIGTMKITETKFNNSNQFKNNAELENTGFIGVKANGPTPQIQITKIKDMFREETSWIQNLQDIQLLIPFEETADQAMESLREILLTEYSTQEQESLREDILAGSVQAQTVLQSHFQKNEINNNRDINPHSDSAIGTSAQSSLKQQQHFNTEKNQNASVNSDQLTKRASILEIPTLKKGSNKSQKAFGMIDTDANEGLNDRKHDYRD
jgi:hypothetical protein